MKNIYKNLSISFLALSLIHAETIDGHKLPPEPQNPDAMLLGVKQDLIEGF